MTPGLITVQPPSVNLLKGEFPLLVKSAAFLAGECMPINGNVPGLVVIEKLTRLLC